MPSVRLTLKPSTQLHEVHNQIKNTARSTYSDVLVILLFDFDHKLTLVPFHMQVRDLKLQSQYNYILATPTALTTTLIQEKYEHPAITISGREGLHRLLGALPRC